ncbi:MAG: hypothetical protein MUE85_22470 [Microscillaceae bacterium]|jgi:ketopantoate reductase|nr:hypothetical protein [Microscillaceae bacterium]
MNKILIIGQGSIGTFVGSALKQAGEEVTHFIRKKTGYSPSVVLNFNDRRAKKYTIKKGTEYSYATLFDLEEIANYTHIIIPVAHYQLLPVLETLAPQLNQNQVLVIMGNIWDDFEWLDTHIQVPFLFVFPNFGGAILRNVLQGWLTPNFTVGVSSVDYTSHLEQFSAILTKTGFKPRQEKNIKGWLMTHFAYNAGMLLEAVRQDGFQKMTKKLSSLKNMYLTMRECINVAKALGIETRTFNEGKTVFQALWWNGLKTYLIFLIPGLAKSVDATKNLEDWLSYGKKVWQTAQKHQIATPILNAFYKKNI